MRFFFSHCLYLCFPYDSDNPLQMFWVRQSECCSMCDNKFRAVLTELSLSSLVKNRRKINTRMEKYQRCSQGAFTFIARGSSPISFQAWQVAPEQPELWGMQQPPRLFWAPPLLLHSTCILLFPGTALCLALALVATEQTPCYSSRRGHWY